MLSVIRDVSDLEAAEKTQSICGNRTEQPHSGDGKQHFSV